MGRFEIYQDKAEQWRFRLIAGNNKIIAVGEGYTTEAMCRKGIKSVKWNAPLAKVVEV